MVTSHQSCACGRIYARAEIAVGYLLFPQIDRHSLFPKQTLNRDLPFLLSLSRRISFAATALLPVVIMVARDGVALVVISHGSGLLPPHVC